MSKELERPRNVAKDAIQAYKFPTCETVSAVEAVINRDREAVLEWVTERIDEKIDDIAKFLAASHGDEPELRRELEMWRVAVAFIRSLKQELHR